MKRRKKRTKTIVANNWNFDDVCNQIDNIATKLAKEITNYDAYSLIHRAFWINAYQYVQPSVTEPSENKDILSSRTLEFIQNYIASVTIP